MAKARCAARPTVYTPPSTLCYTTKRLVAMRSPLLLLVALLVLPACSPNPVYRLSASDADVSYWDAGRAYLFAQSDSVAVEVSYELTTQEGHVFDVGFSNRGDRSIVIDPAHIAAQMLSRSSALMGGEVAAFDPEAVMLDLDLESSRREASNRTSRLVEGIGAGISLAAATVEVSAADEPGEASEAVARYAVDETARVGRVILEERDHELDQAAIAGNRNWWSDAALRRSTLQPGQAVRGWVLVPVDVRAGWVELLIPIGDETARFRFEQSQHKP